MKFRALAGSVAFVPEAAGDSSGTAIATEATKQRTRRLMIPPHSIAFDGDPRTMLVFPEDGAVESAKNSPQRGHWVYQCPRSSTVALVAYLPLC